MDRRRAPLILLLAACSGAKTRELPAELVVNKPVVLEVDAKGVQRYGCEAGAWTLVAPEAVLRIGEKVIGKHGAGPTWTHADGSNVVGTKVADATVDATAIPWFRLDAASHNDVPGLFAQVTAIVRRDTTGGLAPSGACKGGTIDVPYTARYVFYR